MRKAAKVYGINRRTVKKMTEHRIPPGYRRTEEPRASKLSEHFEWIREIVGGDKAVPRKQRHTACRIYQRLIEERGYKGGYTIVREYVRALKGTGKEMYCPLLHPAGNAQVDFGEAVAIIGGEEVKIHVFVMDIPQSDACFVKAYPKENTESFCDGHVSAFEFLGGVPREILYDNTKIAVARILGDGTRKKTKGFCELQSYYLFAERFARVGKGNDKGKVENLVGYSRRNFMVPVPRFETFQELNAHLEKCCLKRQDHQLRGHNASIGERLKADQAAFISLPPVPYEAFHFQAGKVNSLAMVSYQRNHYSVPTRYGYQDVFIKGFVNEVVISHGATIIARHKRCYASGEFIYEPRHYLKLLSQKTEAFSQAAPLAHWNLPEEFGKLESILKRRDGKEGVREYIKILRLLEDYTMEDVARAVTRALQLGVFSRDAVKHLLLCQLDKRPESLDLSQIHSHIPHVKVRMTSAQDYTQLLGRSSHA